MPQTKSNGKKKAAASKQTSSKKSTAKKTTAARKTPPRQTAKTAPAAPVRTKRLSNEIKGILVIAVGLFLALAFFTGATGIVGSTVKNIVGGLFGGAAYFFFIFVIWTGINFFIDKQQAGNGYKYWLLAGMMLFSGVLAALVHEDTAFDYLGFWEGISSMYTYGADGYSGGVLGGGLCKLLVKLIGVSGAWVITVAVMLIFVILLTGVSLERLFTKIAQMIQKHSHEMAERARSEVPVRQEIPAIAEEEYPAPPAKKRRRKQSEPVPGQERYGPVASDYFEMYFKADDLETMKSAADISAEHEHGNTAPIADEAITSPEQETSETTEQEAEQAAVQSAMRKFSLELDQFLPEEDPTEDTDPIASENTENAENTEHMEENDDSLPFDLENVHTGVLTELPNEKGEFTQPVQNEEGTDYEPPSEAKLADVLDPLTQQAVDAGVPLDRAVVAAKNGTVAVSETLANTIDDLATESVEATRLINYQLPPLSLLAKPVTKGKSRAELKAELEDKANRLLTTLSSFKVEANILNVTQGPSVTRFELQPGFGVKVSKITNLADDIALTLAAPGVRIEAPIPGKSAIGIEIPNEKPSAVPIREVLDTDKFRDFDSKTAFALGKDIGGNCIIADIKQFPHILIAGATGSGKSVCINSLITSILYKAKPDEVKMIMVDPKMVELGVYNGIPHLLIPVVTDPKHAAGALNWAVVEMKNRYNLLNENKVRNLQGFNELMEKEGKPEEKLPEIVIIIDELADLMMAAKSEVEDAINSLAALARAAGMYLVLATQRPSVDVITGVIKANVPSRISFAVSSQIDSRTIIDSPGAEKLLGKGDMLYNPRGATKPMRIQGNFVSDAEIEDLVSYIKGQYEATYDENVLDHIEKEHEQMEAEPDETRSASGDVDALFFKAAELAVDSGQASVAMLQRRFKIGYQRAARIIDQLEEKRVIGPYEGTKPRQVLLSRQELLEMQMNHAE
uniref:FtsK domain-containing protein n=1 Tax=uncultured Bacillota bacterium TaxID=344338 RepID=A0A650EMP0_9FIRM|nr:hypothetical protein Firmicute1046_1930 [uncultured Firmicutes bacterium]